MHSNFFQKVVIFSFVIILILTYVGPSYAASKNHSAGMNSNFTDIANSTFDVSLYEESNTEELNNLDEVEEQVSNTEVIETTPVFDTSEYTESQVTGLDENEDLPVINTSEHTESQVTDLDESEEAQGANLDENEQTQVLPERNYESENTTDEDELADIHPELYQLHQNYTLEELNALSHDSVRYYLVKYAITFLGNPYIWGGTSLTNGTDCSGFTQSIYNNFNISIPRTADQQYQNAIHLKKNELFPGDLVFYCNSKGFINHVALYIGNNQVIHASSSKVGIIISNMNYRKPAGYGTYIDHKDKLYDGFYVSGVYGNYFNGVRASSYTIGYGSNSNIGMGICCDHGAPTASVYSGISQSGSPTELESYGYSQELQFKMAILCSLAPYANEGRLINTYFNWNDFGCKTASQANALCSLACSYLCGRNYGNVSQAKQLGDWVSTHCHDYWDYWGYIENTTLSNSTQTNITQIVKQNGQYYYMSKPMQLSGNNKGSTFKLTNASIEMKAVVSNTNSSNKIMKCFENFTSNLDTYYYADAQNVVIDQNEYLTLFYPISNNTIGKTITAHIIPSKAGAVYRLLYYFPSGGFQPVVLCDGSTTSMDLSLSLTASPMREISIEKVPRTTSITNNNPNYRLNGAAYTIYDVNGNIANYFVTSKGKMAKAQNLKTDDNGNVLALYDGTYTSQIHVLPGIYFVKETKASPGYRLDSCATEQSPGHCVDVRTKSTGIVYCNEPPVYSNIPITIYKKDVEPGVLSNNQDLSGATFKVCYYNKLYNAFDMIQEKPTKVWYIETKKNEANKFIAKLHPLYLSKEYKSSSFYKDNNGNIILPLGTLKISEVKAPDNYYNVNYHGSYYDGVNLIQDVTDSNQATFFGTIRVNSNRSTGAGIFVNSSSNQTTNVPVYSNLSISYFDRMKPTIETHAFVDETNSNLGSSVTDNNCYDQVILKGLSKGTTYTIKSQIVNKKDGKIVKDCNGKDCISTKTIVPDNTEITTKLYIGKLSGDMFAGQELVIQEFVKWKDKVVVKETDLNNTNQTISFPTIGTKAQTDGNTIYAANLGIVKITDTVTYQGLIPNKEYQLRGTIMQEDTSPLFDTDGNPCTVEQSFTPQSPEGSVAVTFLVDTSKYALNGLKTVIYEDLFINNVKIATHSDINDSNQTIYFPNAKTSLMNEQTQTQNIILDDHINLIDTVTYENLEIGSKHLIKGILMNKTTGKPIKDKNNKNVTSEISFIPDKEKGEIAVPYSFDIDISQFVEMNDNNDAIVCFENIYRIRDNAHIIQHEDINDIAQTVYIPNIKTKAWEEKSETNTAEAKKDITIIDTIQYSGLIKGESYKVKGILMIPENEKIAKNSHQPFLLNHKPVISEKIFEAKDINGTVDVSFTFDASSLANQSIVVFEELYDNDQLIATHSDINCKEQTIHFVSTNGELTIRPDKLIEDGEGTGTGTVQTGDKMWFLFVAIFICTSIIGIILSIYLSQSGRTKHKFYILILMLFGCSTILISNTCNAKEWEDKTNNHQITKYYDKLKEKNNQLLDQTIKEGNITYILKSVDWIEKPIKETVSYHIDYGYCTKKPEYSNSYDYTYISPTTNESKTITLPFKELITGESSWVDGFKAVVTLKNINSGIYTLGNHTFNYTDNLNLTSEDFLELIHLLNYDDSKYRFHSYKWREDAYTGEDGTLWRDLDLFGEQYATNYSAYYSDIITVGYHYQAIVTYEEENQNNQSIANDSASNDTNANNIDNITESNTLTQDIKNRDAQSIDNNTLITSDVQDNEIVQSKFNVTDESVNPDELSNQIKKKNTLKIIVDIICCIAIFSSIIILYLSFKKQHKTKSKASEA